MTGSDKLTYVQWFFSGDHPAVRRCFIPDYEKLTGRKITDSTNIDLSEYGIIYTGYSLALVRRGDFIVTDLEGYHTVFTPKIFQLIFEYGFKASVPLSQKDSVAKILEVNILEALRKLARQDLNDAIRKVSAPVSKKLETKIQYGDRFPSMIKTLNNFLNFTIVPDSCSMNLLNKIIITENLKTEIKPIKDYDDLYRIAVIVLGHEKLQKLIEQQNIFFEIKNYGSSE